mgnify:CR=1 FL=1
MPSPGEKQAKAAAQAVRDRARLLYEGKVPEETRTAEQDFTTSYARPLPGSARMYPETDIPAVNITEEEIREIEENLPDTLEEREEKYSDMVGEELSSQIVYSDKLQLFEEFKDKYDPKLVANFFTNIYSALQKEVDVEALEHDQYERILQGLDEEKISNDDLEELISKVKKDSRSVEEVVEEIADSKTSEEEIREIVKDIIQEKEEMIEEQGMHAQGALMGQVMGRVEADGGTVSRILQEELKKVLE